PHGYHRRARVTRPVVLTQITPSTARPQATRAPLPTERTVMRHAEPGPVLTLSGEADLTTVAELSEALTAQLASGARHLTVDLSRLRFADSAVIRSLVLADRTLKQRGGGLALAHPQPVVARALSLLGVDQAI